MRCDAGRDDSETIDAYSCPAKSLLLERAAHPPNPLTRTHPIGGASLPSIPRPHLPNSPHPLAQPPKSRETKRHAAKTLQISPLTRTKLLLAVASISASEPDGPRLMTLLFPDSRSRDERGAGEVSEHGWGKLFFLVRRVIR